MKIDEFVIRPEFGTKQSTHRWACCQSAIRHGEPEPSTVGPRQSAPEALPATTHRSAVLPSCSSTACLPICLPIGPILIRLVLGRMLGTLRASVPGGVTLADAEAVRAAASRELSTAATMSRDVSHGTCRTLANANCPCRRNPRNETRLGALGAQVSAPFTVLRFGSYYRRYDHPVSPPEGVGAGPAEGDCPDHDDEGSAVTTKSAFTEDEWSRIVRAPMVAGLAISVADPGGPIEAAKESMATIRSTINPPSREQLLTEVALEVQAMTQQRHNPLARVQADHGPKPRRTGHRRVARRPGDRGSQVHARRGRSVRGLVDRCRTGSRRSRQGRRLHGVPRTADQRERASHAGSGAHGRDRMT